MIANHLLSLQCTKLRTNKKNQNKKTKKDQNSTCDSQNYTKIKTIILHLYLFFNNLHNNCEKR